MEYMRAAGPTSTIGHGADTLRGRVQMGLVALALAVAGIAVAGGYSVARVVVRFDEAHEELRNEALPLGTLRSSVLSVAALGWEAVLLGGPDASRRLEEEIAEVDQAFERIERESLREEGVFVAQARQRWTTAIAVLRDLGITGGGVEQASQVIRFGSAVSDSAALLREAAETSSADADDELADAYSTRRAALATITIVSIVALGTLWSGRRQLVRSALDPLGRLSAAARRLESGDLTARVPVEDLQELRQVAAAFNEMATKVEQSYVELSHLALHDPLTGLPNRARAARRLEEVATSPAPGGVAVVIVDLDGFKGINDTAGHHVGDQVLQQASHRLTACVRHGDLAARLGGDEFMLILEADRDHAAATAVRVANVLAQPFDIEGQRYRVTASVGVAHTESRRIDFDELVRDGDRAMYEAKEEGPGTVRFHRGPPPTSSLPSDLRTLQ